MGFGNAPVHNLEQCSVSTVLQIKTVV